jgi:hypothetical protein
MEKETLDSSNKIVVVKGTIFCDVDGTLVNSGTKEPIQENIDQINKAYDDGYKIVLTTFRGNENWGANSFYNERFSLILFQRIGLKYHQIVWNSPSPRVIINDDLVSLIKIEPNQAFIIL